MIINKKFDTLKKAEKFINSLYNKYDQVSLIGFPYFGESGIYSFRVN